MKYYTGNAIFDKGKCKEYKTLKGALDAAKKKGLTAWDENGKCVFEQKENIASERSNEQEASEEEMQQVKASEMESITSEIVFPKEKMKAVVICDGSLNLRRSPSWASENICGRAVKGQTFFVKSVHVVEGKKIVETIDGLFLSGQEEHIKMEKLN